MFFQTVCRHFEQSEKSSANVSFASILPWQEISPFRFAPVEMTGNIPFLIVSRLVSYCLASPSIFWSNFF